MKKHLGINNLYFTHFDNSVTTLEFTIAGKHYFIKTDMYDNGDEDFWDNEDNVNEAIATGELVKGEY